MFNASTIRAALHGSVVLCVMGAAAAAQEKVEVTPETYICAEVDGRMAVFQQRAGGVNKFYLIRRPTPTDEQPVVRMNRDTLYGGAVIDTEGGASITMPEITDGRYFTVYLIDNDHYVVGILEGAGTHQIPSGTTKYVIAVPRIELMDPTDEAEIAHVAGLLEQIRITAASSDPFQAPAWDFDSTMKLRTEYEKEFVKFDQYPAEWMDVKGKASEETRHVGVAGAWGLFPETEAVYINYAGPADGSKCYRATYEVPPNDAFWSITAYGSDAFMKSDNASISEGMAEMNEDGTVTVYFGSAEACGADKPNRIDITDGWNFLMRVYRPGQEVLDRAYVLPEVEEVAS